MSQGLEFDLRVLQKERAGKNCCRNLFEPDMRVFEPRTASSGVRRAGLEVERLTASSNATFSGNRCQIRCNSPEAGFRFHDREH